MKVTPAAIDSPRAWLMGGLATFGYAIAVMQRTSFGVATLLASERFQVGASLVSLFVVVQLLTYASMQVPAGVLADRFGTRLTVSVGAVLMCLGQLDLAFSTSLPSAVIARILVGAGDALTFTSVLRLLPSWFSPRRIPLLNQLVAQFGQLGQILSSVPLAAMLGTTGWTTSFAAAASVSALAAVTILAFMRDTPSGRRAQTRVGSASATGRVSETLRLPATRLAFWVHWLCGPWGMIFAYMWGYPFLLHGEGYPQPVASGLFSVMVLAGVPFGPVIGLISHRAPLQRTNLALMIALLAAVPWGAVLLWPGQAPLWLLSILMIGLAANGPGSMIGFDIARGANPLRQMGTATGMVIVGGFASALLNIWLIGVVLDLQGGYTLAAFKLAMATQFIFFGVGIAGAYVSRTQARRHDGARGVRYTSLWSSVRRHWRWWFRQVRALGGAVPTRRVATARVPLPAGGRGPVWVAAVVPGTGGRLVAIDVPLPDTTPDWWVERVADYLAVVADPESEVGSVEVRCDTADEVARVKGLLDAELARQGKSLPVEVVLR